MSGGSQHNPNGRQSQLGSGWSPLQVANFLARAPQVHMAADRGVTWHTPTPPPHLYHVPAPSPPDPLQAMKSAGSNSVYRHTGTPPELYRHTPTPPDKHMHRHTPSPGDVKAGAPLPQPELYPHLGPGRDKLRPEELLAYARVGVDLSIPRAANGSPSPHPPHPASPALSVRDAPTINSLIARAQPRHHHRPLDSLLERLGPTPHSVIVHPRLAPTPSPPSSNEDSADSCGAPPGSKRKRKPERTIRVPSAPPPAPLPAPALAPAPPARATPPPPALPRATPPLAHHTPPPAPEPPQETTIVPPPVITEPTPCPEPTQIPPEVPQPTPEPPSPPKPVENGETLHSKVNGPEKPASPPPAQQPERPARRKRRSGSAETIDDIAAMIASTDRPPGDEIPLVEQPQTPTVTPVTVDNLKSVLASPEPKVEEARQSPKQEEKPETSATAVEAAAAPRRRNARTSNSESANVPVESPSEAKPAEPETSEAPTAEPTAASFVEVENQLEKMFAGIEEELPTADDPKEEKAQTAKAKKRRKSAPTKGEKAARRASRASTDDGGFRRKAARKKEAGKAKKKEVKDAYDSGSNASSSRSRGPYIQIRGPRDSPVSVSVINAQTGEEETSDLVRRKPEEFRNGLRARGLHASTLGLRYDATTPDVTWLCVFCERGPHAAGLGDLFGPYSVDMDCEEYRALDEATRRRYSGNSTEVWFHCACALWAPGLVAAGARLRGLRGAVWAARGARCVCAGAGAVLACAARACRARAHLPCASERGWMTDEDSFRALCPAHKD